jgi:hypothetical protein
MPRQFVACKFRPTDTRTFTYFNDGEPLAVGNLVKVPDARSDGWKRVEVAEIDVPEPTQFACKPVLGLWEPEAKPEPTPDDLLADAKASAAVDAFLGDRA